jgi:hypothetical protein
MAWRAVAMQEYTVVDLSEEELEAAYFLVHAAHPDLSLEDWLFRARLLESSGGALGLRGPDDMLFGLMTYRRQKHPRAGATLAIDMLTVFELVRNGSGRRLLLEAAQGRADRLGCAAIAFRGADQGLPSGRAPSNFGP